MPDGRLNTKKIEDHGIKSPHFLENGWKKANSEGLLFLAPKSLQAVAAAMTLKDARSLEEKP